MTQGRMRAVITGSNGFVGRYLGEYLRAMGDHVIGLGDEVDITKPRMLKEAFSNHAGIDVVYHLAARSHVGESWERPDLTYEVNVLGTANLCAALASLRTRPKLVFISSSEVYGIPRDGELPYQESAAIRPVTPYAASKAAAEAIVLQAWFGRELPVVISRSFNHTGPGQSPSFVVSGFAKRAAEAMLRSGGSEPIPVGNLDAERDFTDVRDVVRAYRLLAARGLPGQAYNVCSGIRTRIASIADILSVHVNGKIRFVTDPSLVRSVEIPTLFGSFDKLREATGWEPEIPFAETVVSLYD
ncbi:MAG: GDP-mannose 4,6-dehydratase, partial [Acidimicrobiales bacterium]